MTEEKAILAGGCFWGMEDLFRRLPGVTDTSVGYSGGDFPNPTYADMRTGQTGHAEAIAVTFDTEKTDYRRILEFFFSIHDPTTPDRQGNDRGPQYRSAIFYLDEAQKDIAQTLIREIEVSGKWPGKIVTELAPAEIFYPAEEYHQDYLEKHPGGYTCHWIRPTWKL